MTAEPALKLVTSATQSVEEKALSIVEQAQAVQVKDPAGYTAAGTLWKAIRDMMKEVADTFDPIIEQAHKAHKKALEQKNKYYSPLDQAARNVKAIMSAYDAEQERLRREEQRRLEEEARKAAEEAALLEAIAAEEEAIRNGATREEAAQEAEAIAEAPVYVPTVTVPKATPKLEGGPIYREIWSAQVVNVRELCRAIGAGQVSEEAVIGLDRYKDGVISSPALNKLATALKATLNIPGVKAFMRRV